MKIPSEKTQERAKGGDEISLFEAGEIALRILSEARAERLQLAEEQAQRGIQWDCRE